MPYQRLISKRACPGDRLAKPPCQMHEHFRWRALASLLATLLMSACGNSGNNANMQNALPSPIDGASQSISVTHEPVLQNSVKALTLSTLTGDRIALREINSPVLINFWSTSCHICVAEMPELAELYEDYVNRGLLLVAVAMPYDPPNHVLEMAQARRFPFPVALDIQGEAVEAFGPIKGTPTSFLLDARGRLVQRYIGAIPFDEVRSELDKLLGVS